jgi:hypothetical protein
MYTYESNEGVWEIKIGGEVNISSIGLVDVLTIQINGRRVNDPSVIRKP